MANRRMFSKEVIGTDNFTEMPPSSRALYFELGMFADDDGFVSPRGVMRMYGHTEDDIKVLTTKGFVIPFKSGVVVVRHWKTNNLIRGDRYSPTQFIEEKILLGEDDNGNYIDISELHTTGLPLVNPGKVSIGEVSIEKEVVAIAPTLRKRENPFSSLKGLTPPIVEEIANIYGVSISSVNETREDLELYCGSKGKRYANYKLALMNWVRRRVKSGEIKKTKFRVGERDAQGYFKV